MNEPDGRYSEAVSASGSDGADVQLGRMHRWALQWLRTTASATLVGTATASFVILVGSIIWGCDRDEVHESKTFCPAAAVFPGGTCPTAQEYFDLHLKKPGQCDFEVEYCYVRDVTGPRPHPNPAAAGSCCYDWVLVYKETRGIK